MEGVLVRARAKIIEDDEKPTNFFCNLEKYKSTSKIVPKLKANYGKTSMLATTANLKILICLNYLETLILKDQIKMNQIH